MWFERALLVFIVFLCNASRGQDFINSNNFEDTITSTTYLTFEDAFPDSAKEYENIYDDTSTFASQEFTTEVLLAKGEKKISETILEMLEHFKKPNHEGIPGVEIPDPYSVPDMQKRLTYFDTLYFENMNVYGLSKMKLLYVNADFEDMEVNAAMRIDKLQTRGTYRYSSFLMPRRGSFTVNVTGLKITPRGTLRVKLDGKVKTEDINIDISFDTIVVNFENLGSLGNILQGFINTAGHFIFENIRPHILRDTYTKAREEIDKKLEEMAGDVEFPNSIAPLDVVLVDARRKVREMGYDPYILPDYKNAYMSYATVSLTNSWITGLSSFHRIGDMILSLENNTVTANFQIGSQKLEGSTLWDISAALMTITGSASFSVEYISVRIVITQSLDTRKKPLLKEFHIDVGNIQARCDGAGTIDYIIEFAVNILPNLLRYQIVAALEEPLIAKLQEQLNRVDVEMEIKTALPKIDEYAKTGINLSFLRGEKTIIYDEDDFFNF